MRTFAILLACTAIGLPLRSAEKSVPVTEEPMHRVVLENADLRVIDVQIKPGETSLFHIHVIPSVVIYLTRSTNRSESWPDKAILTRDVSPGQSRYAPYDEKPLTHRVTNTGAGLFRVLDIELLNKPAANETLPALMAPQIKPQWEEKLARSSALQLEPKAKVALPASRCASLVVAISGSVRVTSDRAKAGAVRTLQWGEYQFFPAGEGIQIMNTGKETAEMVFLEVKH